MPMIEKKVVKLLWIPFVFILILLAGCRSEASEETPIPSPLPATKAVESPTEVPEVEPIEETPKPKPSSTPEEDQNEIDTTAAVEADLTETPVPSNLIAVIVSGDSAGLGKPFTFDATQSQFGDSEIISYEWDMGDGTFLFGITIEHSYREPGLHTVTLTVEDEEGNRDSTTVEVEVVDLDVTPTAAPDNSLAGTSWEMDNALRGTYITLEFKDAALSGSSGCNTYTAGYTTWEVEGASGSIEISSVSSTGISCTAEVMAQERGFLDSLTEAESYTIVNDTLTLELKVGKLTFSQVLD